MQLDELPIDYLDTRAAEFDAVSREDIQRVATEYLNPKNMVTVMVGQPEGLGSDIKTLTELPNVR
jgi:zinc protease